MTVCEEHRKTPAKGYSPCPGCEIERLLAQAKHEADCAEAYKAEAAHWKNNHATEVRRARVLKERTDMPLERVQAYEKWQADLQEIAAWRARFPQYEYRPQDECVALRMPANAELSGRLRRHDGQ